MSGDELYKLRDLEFRYDRRFCLKIDAFELRRGEKVAILGQNGSGKTTLLRVLAGLEKPTSARVFTFQGIPVAKGGVDRRGLGFLRQQPHPFRGTVSQNLAYPLHVRGIPRAEREARIEDTLSLVDLISLREAPARRLSGGEQKRMALARVLISKPELLLLDEPAAHLDRRSRSVIERVLLSSRGTILLTTHDLHLAHRVAGRVLNLMGGRISPSLPENVLEGRREGDKLLTRGGLRVCLPPDLPPLAGEENLAVMIDPRNLVLSPEALPSSMRNHFRGRVCSVREQGANVWLEIDCGEKLTVIISRASYDDLGINLNRSIVVSFKANAVEVL